MIDNLSTVPGLTYVTGSAKINGVTIPDSGSFPLAAPGYLIPDIPPGESSTIVYDAKITATSGSLTNSVYLNNPNIRGGYTVVVAPAACTLEFTGNDYGASVSTYSENGTLYVKLNNAAFNQSPTIVDSATVAIKNPAAGTKDTEILILTETGADTGIFTGSLPSSASAGQTANDGTLFFQQGDSIEVSSTYPSCSADTASIAVPSKTKTLYLSDDGGSNDSSGDLDRIDPTSPAHTDTDTDQTLALDNTTTAVVDTSAPSTFTKSSPAAGTRLNSVTVSHNIGTGSNRLLMVSIGLEADNNSPITVSSVTFGGRALTISPAGVAAAGTEARSQIWYLLDKDFPTGTSANVVVTFTGSNSNDEDVVVGVNTFKGVDQATPFGTFAKTNGSGTSASANVTLNSGELAFGLLAVDDSRRVTVTGGTNLWTEYSDASPGDGISASVNTRSGTGSQTLSWGSFSTSDDWALTVVAIKPVTSSLFTQAIDMAGGLSMPASSQVNVVAHISAESGLTHNANYANVTATLTYVPASGPEVTIATLGSASYSDADDNGVGTLSWSGTLGSALTIPTGANVKLVIRNSQAGATFKIDYDSSSAPSRIDLPTTTVITADSLALYDAPYPGGSQVTTANNGQTLYARAVASDPFGAYDITSLGLNIDGPGDTCDQTPTLGAGNVVNTATASKTYEYVWNTAACEGTYTLTATAKEGTENTITATRSTQVNLSALDLGTPGIVQFIDGSGADKTSYTTAQQVCLKVTDLDQAGTGSVTVSVSPGSRSLTLTEVGGTGVFSGCFSGPDNPFTEGDVPSATYTDPNDATDVATDTALVTNSAVPSLLLSKMRVAPADGIAVVGEPVQYNLTVTNPGASTISSAIALTDTFSETCYTFSSASVAPNSQNATTLTWNNVGPLAAGASRTISVSFVAKAGCDSTAAENQLTATVGGTAAGGTQKATVTINDPKLTVVKALHTGYASPFNIGSQVQYDITVTNTGNVPINTVPLVDQYSSCLQYKTDSEASQASAGGGVATWDNIGPLATSQTKIITVTFDVIGACSTADNTADISYATTGANGSGDSVPPVSYSVNVETKAASIGGQVVNDANGNGTKDAETGIPGVTVRLYRDSNGDGDLTTGTVTLVAVQTTDGSGNYQFLNLASNTGSERYIIVEADPANYQSTNDADGGTDAKKIDNKITLNVTAIKDYPDQNFLDVRPAISGQVVNDANNNGTKNSGETGIAGVTVSLYTDVNNNGIYDSSTDTLVGSPTTTDANGNYHFLGVAAGNYLVVETDPSGATSTGDKDGNELKANGFNTITIGSFSPNAPSSGNDFLDYFTSSAPDVFTAVDAPASVEAGDPVTALVTFGNAGDATAEGVTYTVTLPADLTGVSCTGATCSYNSTTGVLTITGLSTVLIPGQFEQVLVHYTAPDSGPLTVTSLIKATDDDGETGNNTDDGETTVSAGGSAVDVAAWLKAPPSALIGETVNVPVNFTNLGGVTAEGVTYSLTLPDKPIVATCAGSGVSCTYNSGTGVVTITGLPDTLAPGQTVGLILSYYTSPAASASPVDVVATVSATDDAAASNNTATGETVINATPIAPDVISLVAPPATAVPGSTVTVPVSYSNLGPDPASVTLYNLSLSDTVSDIEIRRNGALCTYDLGTGALNGCGLPATLVPGQIVDLVLTYTAPASGTVTVNSNITATGPAPGSAAETNTANNPSSGSTLIAAASVPDVYTTVDVPATVPPGEPINVLVTFGNQGLAPADGVTYTVTLPPDLSGAVDCTGATCIYDSATGLLAITGLPVSLSPGQSEIVLISYPAPASGAASLESVIATTTAGETPTNNNRALASTAVESGDTTDVTTWIAAPATANSGGATVTVTVTAGFTNLGTDDAENVAYKLVFTRSPANITVTHNGTACNYSSGTISGCGLPSTLIPGQIVTLFATYTAPASGPVIVTSDVYATNDSDSGNNTASASTAIPASPATVADVTASVAPPPTATAGSTVSVPVTFANLGPATAAGVTYTLTLPTGLTNASCTGSGVSCTYNSGTGAVNIAGLPGTLASGQSVGLTLSYAAPDSGDTVDVTAAVATTTTDTNEDNNTATGLTTIPTTAPNVDVYALANAPPTTTAGGPVNVTLTFGNAGSGTASGVTYSALLPAGLIGVSCTTGGVTCDYDSASGLVMIGGLSATLDPGATTAPVTLTYTAPAAPGTVPVTARISANGDPGIGGNNSATDRTRIAAASPPPPSSHSIPTLSEWAMLLLLALMMSVGLRYQRRR